MGALATPSEELEVFAARIIGRLGMNVENADDENEIHGRCVSLWWAVRGLDHIAIANRTALKYDDPTGVHFSIAMNNERGRIARYIEHKTGCDPETHPMFRGRT